MSVALTTDDILKHLARREKLSLEMLDASKFKLHPGSEASLSHCDNPSSLGVFDSLRAKILSLVILHLDLASVSSITRVCHRAYDYDLVRAQPTGVCGSAAACSALHSLVPRYRYGPAALGCDPVRSPACNNL